MTPPKCQYRLTEKGLAVVNQIKRNEEAIIRAEVINALEHPNDGTFAGIEGRRNGVAATVNYFFEHFHVYRKKTHVPA